MKLKNLKISEERLAEFCRRHHIRKLSFFGSILREDFAEGSDVYVRVEFEPDVKVGLIRLAGIELELSQLLGRKVDLNTAGFLSPYFREEVLRESETYYVKTLGPNQPAFTCWIISRGHGYDSRSQPGSLR